MTMHRRPLGRGRTLAALGGALIVFGCILPWWQVGGTPGITAETGNGLAGSAILVFLVGIATLALVALPYLDRKRAGVGVWFARERRVAVTIFTICVVAAVVLTVIGTYFRGPNWGWVWPWATSVVTPH